MCDLDISKTAADYSDYTSALEIYLAVKIILQKLFCFADKFSTLLTQFNRCTIEPFTIERGQGTTSDPVFEIKGKS